MNIKNKQTDIIWSVVFIYILQSYVLSKEFTFIFGFVWLLQLLIKSSKNGLRKKTITGLNFYMVMMLISIILGLFQYPFRVVIRDTFYVFPSIVFMLIGFYLNIGYGTRKSLIKTAILCCFITASINFITIIATPSILSNMYTLRASLTQTISTEIVLPIVIIIKIVERKIFFTKIVDNIIISALMMHLVLSLGRTQYIGAISMFLVLYGCYVIAGKINFSKAIKFYSLIAFVCVGIYLMYQILPETVLTTFTDKLGNSFKEVNSAQEFTSTAMAMNDWRAYEIQQAKVCFSNGNIFTQIFGYGYGKGIGINYVPYNWTSFVEIVDGEAVIPLLHNGYYTILIKSGILGLFSLLAMCFLNIKNGWRMLKKDNMELVTNGAILVSLFIILLIHTYVVRGIIEQFVWIIWTMLVGWIVADTKYYKSRLKLD
jgi:hypothetical protein